MNTLYTYEMALLARAANISLEPNSSANELILDSADGRRSVVGVQFDGDDAKFKLPDWIFDPAQNKLNSNQTGATGSSYQRNTYKVLSQTRKPGVALAPDWQSSNDENVFSASL
jgi:hypothetical protein